MTKTKSKEEFVYKIFDRKTKNYLAGYNYLADDGKEYKSELAARSAVDYFVSSIVSYKFYETKAKLTKEKLEEYLPYELEIIKIKVVKTEDSVIGLENQLKNTLIVSRLEARNTYDFSYFWENAMKKGYADDIQYIIKLNKSKGTGTMEMIKEARTCLRNLGVKTRTFREYQGMFGFYNKDQALKARLTLDAADFIDIEELRNELFA